MEAYAVVRQRKEGKNVVTWCAGYKFDLEHRKVVLYGDAGGVCGSINLEDMDFKRLDIYNAKRPMDPPVQTFVPSWEVI